MCFSQHKIDGFLLIKKYLESIDSNIEEFDEIYGEIEQHINEILSSLEKYFPDSKDIEFIQRYNWVKNPFLINDKPGNFFYNGV